MHDGVTLQFYPSNTASLHVRIGTTTAQDLAVSLGRPLRVHYKEDDRMTIHSSLQDESDTGCGTILNTHCLLTIYILSRFLQLLPAWNRFLHLREESCCQEDYLAIERGRFESFRSHTRRFTRGLAWISTFPSLQAMQLGNRRETRG